MAREIGEEYLSSLVDLDQNSKPMIDMLTMLAGENSQHAAVIVGVIKQRILEVDQNSKLPLLYLIDSIVKNIGGDYKTLLTQAIVGIFCDVFEKVNERVRLKMFGLRQTWNEVFSPTKLMALDVKVNSLDPNWPISRVPKTGVIHVNPNFWNKIPEAAVEPLEQMKAQLEERRRSLLELQKLKLELELQATKKQIEEEQKKINQTAASVGHNIKLDSVLTMNNNVFSGGQPPKAVTNAKVAPVSASLMATIKPRDNRALSASGTSAAPVQDSGKSKGIEKDAYKMSDNSSSRKKSSPSKSGKSSDSSKSSPTKSSGRHSSKDKKKSSSSRSSNSGSEKSPKRGSSSSSSHRKKSGSRSPNTSSGGKHGHSHSRSYSRKSGRREDGSSDKRRRGGGGVADEKEDVILISGSPPRQLSPVKYADKNGPTVNAVMAAVAATTTTSGGLNQSKIHFDSVDHQHALPPALRGAESILSWRCGGDESNNNSAKSNHNYYMEECRRIGRWCSLIMIY